MIKTMCIFQIKIIKIKIMSAIRVGTCTSASKNTKDRLSDVTLKNNMERSQITSRRILRF